jgi:hypothetical protein
MRLVLARQWPPEHCIPGKESRQFGDSQIPMAARLIFLNSQSGADG